MRRARVLSSCRSASLRQGIRRRSSATATASTPPRAAGTCSISLSEISRTAISPVILPRTQRSGVTSPPTTAEPRPQAPSIVTTDRSPVVGLRVNITPAAHEPFLGNGQLLEHLARQLGLFHPAAERPRAGRDRLEVTGAHGRDRSAYRRLTLERLEEPLERAGLHDISRGHCDPCALELAEAAALATDLRAVAEPDLIEPGDVRADAHDAPYGKDARYESRVTTPRPPSTRMS